MTRFTKDQMALRQEEPADAVDGCGCSLMDGRCDTHAAMMHDIHEAWSHGTEGLGMELWALQDGYGEPGYIPAQGYDFSGIRDSSIEAIEAMYAVIRA